MRNAPNLHVERYRIRTGHMGSSRMHGNNGAFNVPLPTGARVFVIVSDAQLWDHVSVTVVEGQRCPTWEEMCAVKDLFFEPEETVVQFHPAQSQYRNFHEYCLHLWKFQGWAFWPMPDPEMVGPASSDRPSTLTVVR